MGGELRQLGTLEEPGVLPLLQELLERQWSGVLRLRKANCTAALWLVKGQLAHAVLIEGAARLEGPEALELILRWKDGTFWMHAGELPPARTIRQPLDRLTGAPRGGEAPSGGDGGNLGSLLRELQLRVPGLESLSVSHDGALEVTTAHDAQERDWLNHQLRLYYSRDRQVPERLFLEQDEHTVLITRNGPLAAVLSARSGTAPEALFWAAEEARKYILADH